MNGQCVYAVHILNNNCKIAAIYVAIGDSQERKKRISYKYIAQDRSITVSIGGHLLSYDGLALEEPVTPNSTNSHRLSASWRPIRRSHPLRQPGRVWSRAIVRIVGWSALWAGLRLCIGD